MQYSFIFSVLALPALVMGACAPFPNTFLGPCMAWCYETNAPAYGGQEKNVPPDIISGCSMASCGSCEV